MGVPPQANPLDGIDFNEPLDPRVTSTWRASKQVQNKENKRPVHDRRFIDPQPQATKDTWDDSQDDTQPQSRAAQSLKRARPAPPQQTGFEEDEESEDQGFQADTRQVDQRRRVQQAIPSANLSKRARREEPEPIPSSARHADIVDNLPVEQIAATQARVIVQHINAKQKKVQVRTPWSRHDEELLVQLIGELGCSWSILAKDDRWDLKRANMQVDLKDKARNMKVAMLK